MERLENSFTNRDIAGFHLNHIVGRGGMSTVYHAVKNGVEAAVKVMAPSLLDETNAEARFYREAQSLHQIVCPQVVRIFEYGSEAGCPYIIMEFLPGKTLQTILRSSGSLTIPQAIYIAKEVAVALCELARHNMVHRDIKPDNIMLLPQGTVKLTDFGLAKIIGQGMNLTKPDEIWGTLYYMSPEQTRGYPLDSSTDLYSLGAVFYQMLTGRVPFDGDTTAVIFQGHWQQPVTWPPALDIPHALKSIVETLLAKVPEDRFASPESLLEAIAQLGIAPVPYIWSVGTQVLSIADGSQEQESTASLTCPGCRQAITIAHSILRSQPLVTCPHCQQSFPGDALLATDEWYAVHCGQASDARDGTPVLYTSLNSGQILGKYRLEKEIGRGGMGIVFKAHERELERAIALKVLIVTEATSATDIKRFKRGVKAAAKLRHPNIVSIHDGGVWHNIYYCTMDYITGDSLAARLKKQRLTPHEALTYLRDIGKAIAYAHEQGVLHRDIKPANILFDGHDRPLVIDFGLAKEFTNVSSISQSGTMLGTPYYMSPEQIQGTKLDVRSDVYSLGAMLYEMLAARTPHEGETVANLFYSILHKDPIPISKLVSAVHQDIVTICMKAMDKRQEKRYPTAQALVDDIERFLAGRTIMARRDNLAVRAWHFLVRTRVQGKYTLLTLGLLLIMFMGLLNEIAAYQYGLALMATHRRDDAINSFSRALWFRKNQPSPLLYRGLCYEQLGDRTNAMADFNRAIAAKPDFLLGYLCRGRLYFLLGDEDKALQDYDRAVAIQPNHPLSYVYRAEIYLGREDFPKAGKELEMAVNLPPPSAEEKECSWRSQKGRVFLLLAIAKEAEKGIEAECLGWLEKALDSGFDDYPAIWRMLPWARWSQSAAGKKLIARFPGLSQGKKK